MNIHNVPIFAAKKFKNLTVALFAMTRVTDTSVTTDNQKHVINIIVHGKSGLKTRSLMIIVIFDPLPVKLPIKNLPGKSFIEPSDSS